MADRCSVLQSCGETTNAPWLRVTRGAFGLLTELLSLRIPHERRECLSGPPGLGSDSKPKKKQLPRMVGEIGQEKADSTCHLTEFVRACLSLILKTDSSSMESIYGSCAATHKLVLRAEGSVVKTLKRYLL